MHAPKILQQNLQKNCPLSIYQAVTRRLLGANPQPIVLVDWSDYTYDRSHLILRAAIPVGGRGLTLYEEVHPYKFYR